MGNKQSQSQTSKVLNDILNKSLTNINQDVVNRNINSCNIRQTVNSANYGNIKCGRNFNATNELSSLCNMTNIFKTKSEADIKSLLKQAVSSSMSQSSDAVQGFASNIGAKQDQDSKTEVNNILSNIIDNNISMQTINECITSSNPDQFVGYINYNNIETGGDCNFSNKAQVQSLSSCLTDTIMKAAADNSAVAEAITKTDQQQKAKQSGISELIDSIFSGMTTPFIISGIVLLFIIIGAVIYLLSPAGQEATKKLADAGAEKIKSSPMPLPV